MGGEGISTTIREERGNDWWTINKPPPAPMLIMLVNSKKGFPALSAPRTNTGIATGSRCQRLDSEVCNSTSPSLFPERHPTHTVQPTLLVTNYSEH